MNRIDRLTAIIIFLQGRKFVPIEELAERYSISERTAYRDLRALEEAGVPIGNEPGKGYFILRGYHLPPVMFDKKEAMALLAAERLMQRWSNSELGRSYHSALDKIRSTLPVDEKEYFEKMDEHIGNFYHFEVEAPQPQDRIFSFLQNAIFKKEVISVKYKRQYGDEVTSRDIEPFGLLVMGRNWYLAGWCRLREDYRTFRLDRFESYKTTGNLIDASSERSLKDFYNQKLHTEKELKEVTILVDKKLARMIGDQKYWHGWAWENITGEGVEMTFLTPSINYTAHWLISLGTNVRIMRSEKMKERLRELSEEIAEHYRDRVVTLSSPE
ncbi:MAG: YafY family transcriptional regulator [Balneolaceae bacterium]|nr:YafY family transcriptional regulator [Balneolaceae bacterium]MBO6546835.1 YafY family transcriptional regulator [Balneolaceae bacterium]MBO6649195.1 YafY family transcriptional regulator [Balneolaceae bacterium]